MSQLQNRTILVVGATGAIGASLASQLKNQGAVVYGTASSAESSVRLSENLDLRLLLNLEDSNSIAVLANYLLAQAAPLDAIILASGLVGFGSIAETPDGALERLLKVNATGQIDLAQRLLPKLLDSALAERGAFCGVAQRGNSRGADAWPLCVFGQQNRIARLLSGSSERVEKISNSLDGC